MNVVHKSVRAMSLARKAITLIMQRVLYRVYPLYTWK